MGVGVRPRHPDDLPGLLALLQRTHEQEGYPVRQVAVSAWWLASEHELWSAVAVEGGPAAAAGDLLAEDAARSGRVVGHVALHVPDPDGLPVWQAATGRDADGLMVLSRLFTDRTVRGAGSVLLDAAVRHAADVGREAVLLVDPDSPARGFYLRRGWREVGTVEQTWGHRTVDAVLMAQGR